MSAAFPQLFSPLTISRKVLRNRIMSTGHQTYLAKENLPSDEMIAYHEARAQGGAGLIINESARFHATSLGEAADLTILEDSAIPHYARLARAVQRHGATMIGQLSHSGRVSRRMMNGMRGVVYAPSSVPDDRFHTIARAMPTDLVAEIIAAAGEGARRYAEAGYDGVEILASHGLLFAQFLNPHANTRDDIYGGSFENRLRPLREALAAARRAIGADMLLGLRISLDEDDVTGLESAEVRAVCERLAKDGLVDYVNTTQGTMAALGASIHVVPPMEVPVAYLAPKSASLRQALNVPVFVAGRINQPQIAESVLRAGQADICGMTRALIADPEMPNKAREGRADAIRACIGCNQGCIGHFHAGNAISCIQNPRTGRELRFPTAPATPRALHVAVGGGGPAGMKAALTAAEMGHRVTLFEAGAQLGGQALLAQALPERAEFGGLITNLQTELSERQIEIRLNSRLDGAAIEALAPDAVIVATGARPYLAPLEGRESARVLEADALLRGEAKAEGRVVIADWRCDQIGPSLALLLARAGHAVRLAVNGLCAGQNLQPYLRDTWAGKLHEAGIEVVPYARLYGIDTDTAYFLHGANGQPIILEGVDTLITASGYVADTTLERALEAQERPFVTVGDSTIARGAEEAVYDGFAVTRAFLDALSQGRALPNRHR